MGLIIKLFAHLSFVRQGKLLLHLCLLSVFHFQDLTVLSPTASKLPRDSGTAPVFARLIR